MINETVELLVFDYSQLGFQKIKLLLRHGPSVHLHFGLPSECDTTAIVLIPTFFKNVCQYQHVLVWSLVRC